MKAPDAGRRLDRFVQAALGDVPTSLVQRLLRQKKVRVNDVRGRGDQRLHPGDLVVVHHVANPRESVASATPVRAYEGPPIEVLGELDDFLFVAKPAGVACSDDGHDLDSLALWLASHLRERIERGEVRPEPCHRLDRGTTGVVAVALTARAFERFRRALTGGDVHKEYEVAVWGSPELDTWTCELPLVRRGRVRAREPRMVAVIGDPTGLDVAYATTEFEVITRGERATLLRALPLTGRTHQIRAHCRATGLPVIGDPRYGDDDLDAAHPSPLLHQLLHARRLHWQDPEAAIDIDVMAAWESADTSILLELGLAPKP